MGSGEALTSGGASVVARRASGKRRIWLVGGAAAIALALAVGSLLLRRNVQPPAAPIEITPFTSDGGYKLLPRLSPEGEKVAYAWAGPEDDNWDIYVKPLGVGARSIRLTDHPAQERMHAWSPDGRRIAFVRQVEGKFDLYTVPSLGGQEQRLVEDVGLPAGWAPALAWSPDGDSLVLAERLSEDEPARVTRVSLATLERNPLTSPPEGTFGDMSFALSPDGSQLALFRIRISGPLSYRAWALGRDGLYYAAPPWTGDLRQTYAIWYLDFESGARSELYRKEGPFRHWLLSVSPDERWVLHLERPSRRSELMLVEDFR